MHRVELLVGDQAVCARSRGDRPQIHGGGGVGRRRGSACDVPAPPADPGPAGLLRSQRQRAPWLVPRHSKRLCTTPRLAGRGRAAAHEHQHAEPGRAQSESPGRPASQERQLQQGGARRRVVWDSGVPVHRPDRHQPDRRDHRWPLRRRLRPRRRPRAAEQHHLLRQDLQRWDEVLQASDHSAGQGPDAVGRQVRCVLPQASDLL
mmetsp:Transcript_11803/g.35534  ORF Transcript_11803/g.35534 Transcript_11803/m.35534 type:complete len:205 (+) Transcript_11803:697-1311(+)